MVYRILFFHLFLFLSFSSFGQSINGIVKDKENGAPLIFVQIINLDDGSLTVSNEFGEFIINKKGLYEFSRIGYQAKQILIKDDEYIIFQMQMQALELNEVIINASHIPQKLMESVSTIHVLSQKDIERSNSINIAPVLNRVPGVYMQSGALNTNKITIRGIGSRTLYGTSKIKAYYQDIPLTTGSGETNIEDFELNSISRLEILKGGISSIYGAGLGGTIHLIPKKGLLNQVNIGSGISIGSFGLIKGTIDINYGNNKGSINALYSNTQSEGYRDNNSYERQTISLTSNNFLGEKDELVFVGSYVDLKAFIPSSLNEEDYINNPTNAAFTWNSAKGFEQSKRGVFGISWNHQYNARIKHITSVFSSFKNTYEARPFNILDENTFALGIRTRLLGNAKLFARNLNWTAGTEIFKDWHPLKTFANLYNNFPAEYGSVEGALLSNFLEKRNHYNLFLEADFYLITLTKISVGLNYNQTSYTLNDRFVSSVHNNQSGDYRFKGMLSPKLGFSHLFSDDTGIYGNISHGFSPPTLEETLLPDGQINKDIQPETGWNLEVGIRGKIINRRLQYNLALYRMDIRNLLVTRRTAEDEFIGINAGKTLHKGLELSADYQWIKSDAYSLSSFHTYSLNDYAFVDFVDGLNDFSTNKLTGVPAYIFNSGIDISTYFGFYGIFNYQFVDKIPMTDSNSHFSDSYKLCNIKIGYQLAISKHLNISAYFGLNNLFNEKYASQILINAQGFNGAAPRYYYPGEPRNYYFGINLKNNF